MKRRASLDLLRAGAIVMVVIHHLAVMAPSHLGRLLAFTRFGAYGVELFFVLSGWLVGTLYWGERARAGRVDGPRFVVSRMARTLPPYFAVLPIAWAGAALARGEPFDAGYLLFVQNYYAAIPFFFVSWSLCIEEHFYLALPLLLSAVARRRTALHATFVVGTLVPVVSRFLVRDAAAGASFGYFSTATHMNLTGLVLGVWLSYLAAREADAFARVTRLGPWLVLPLGIVAAVVSRPAFPLHYPLHELSVSLFFAAVLASVCDRELGLSRVAGRIVYALSIAAYSTYLTHSIAIQVALRVVARVAPGSLATYAAVAPVLVCAGAALFFFAIEGPVLRWRRRVFPSPNRGLVLTAATHLAPP